MCDWLCENPPCSHVLHTFTIMLVTFINALQELLCGHLSLTMQHFVKLHTTITKLQHFKHKIGKNLHANMEGFRRASHILYSGSYRISLLLTLMLWLCS